MDPAAVMNRLQFAVTIIYHYIFPQITMGLTLLIFLLKTKVLVSGDETADWAVRFWGKILGVTFAMGVVTGIPMEFQFGTNWSRFSAIAGGVIGQTLAMEGMFAFFLESAFIYLLLYGEKRLGQFGHWMASLLVFVGSWLSGYFIVCTNAWMQHPVAYQIMPDHRIALTSLSGLLNNPWAIVQFLHVANGTVITGSFLMACLASYYLLRDRHEDVARKCLALSVVVGFIACCAAAMPTGDLSSKQVYKYQPAGFAAMEGHFHTDDGAGMVILGQPNMQTMTLDNPITIPHVLSFLTHQRWNAQVIGLTDFPPDERPDFVPPLYYAYHIMVGLGTIFITIMGLSILFLLLGKLRQQRWLLWALLLAVPLPFIANTAGWVTAELGRQPWIIYQIMRTSDAYSQNVSTGNIWFTLLGFLGLYLFLAFVYFFLIVGIIGAGPESATPTIAQPVEMR
ncbi:MAG: cytochrome ubiquinol oxidase subunit I [Tepidisphaeraceae bacterium]